MLSEFESDDCCFKEEDWNKTINLLRKMKSLENIRKFSTQKDNKIIVLEGNIGAGKSTFLKYINELTDDSLCVLGEPLGTWTETNGINLLELAYKDPKRWSSAFQSFAIITMSEMHMKKSTKPVKVMERSVFSTRYCFTEAHHRKRNIDDINMLVVDRTFNFIMDHFPVTVDLIIYIRTTPNVAWERLKKRNRIEEKSMSFDYLQLLHKLYDDWLIRQKFPVAAKVIIIDGNRSLIHMIEELDHELEKNVI